LLLFESSKSCHLWDKRHFVFQQQESGSQGHEAQVHQFTIPVNAIMSTISREDKEEFWIRVYLNQTSDYIDCAIERAYLDFARTQHGIKPDLMVEHKDVKNHIKGFIVELQSRTFGNQDQFDEWHNDKCNLLKTEYKELKGYQLTIGQAQKWINMSLKYLFILGENRVTGISRNYRFFHIPIDNIIQDKLSTKIERIKQPWSRIDDYSLYLEYQKQVRNCFLDEIPLDVEFKMWMKP
jgi:hypothetical protein